VEKVMPTHDQVPFDAMSQMRELLRQKGEVDSRNPTLNRGLLAEGQTSFMDALRNPDQAQVNALLGATAGLINPVQGQWGLTAAAQGLGAFSDQREKEYDYAVDAQKRESESLKDRLSTINDMGKLDLKEREFGYSKGQDTISNKLARDEFGLRESAEDRDQLQYLNSRSDLAGTEQYIDHRTGEVISLERAANKRLYRPGSNQPVDLTGTNFVPFSDTAQKEVKARQKEIGEDVQDKSLKSLRIHQINQDNALNRITGKLSGAALRTAIDIAGAGHQQEVLLKDMRALTVDSILEDLKSMGGNDTEKEAARLEKAIPTPSDDADVWRSYELNEVNDALFNSVRRGRGTREATASVINALKDFTPQQLKLVNDGGLIKPGGIADSLIKTGAFTPTAKPDNVGSGRAAELDRRLLPYRGNVNGD
jgi:hypothetical protein